MNRIGIIVAMREEVIALKRKMVVKNDEEYAGMIFSVGTIEEKEIVMVQAESGGINAAVCAQNLLSKYNVDYIISTGLGAGLSPEVNVGDVVLGSDVLEQLSDKNEVTEEQKRKKVFFNGNKRLIDTGEAILKNLDTDLKVTVGKVASNDTYDARIFIKENQSTTFTAYCAEMEGSSIAYTSYMNNTPFLMIRCISDTANPQTEINYGDFTHYAAKIMVKLIQKLIIEIEE